MELIPNALQNENLLSSALCIYRSHFKMRACDAPPVIARREATKQSQGDCRVIAATQLFLAMTAVGNKFAFPSALGIARISNSQWEC